MRLALLSLWCLGALAADSMPPQNEQRLAREIYKEMIEVKSGFSTGSTTPIAERVAERFKAAGFPSPDIFLGGAIPSKANVVVRYLTNYSFAFTEEYSIALMVVVALLGGSIAAARNHHMRITWFVDNMPRPLAALSNTVAMLATVAMFGLLIVLGGRLLWDEYRFEVTSPGLGEPQ